MKVKKGCSGGMSWFWRQVLGKLPPWEGCCARHDELLAEPYTLDDRAYADLDLARCVCWQGHPVWAAIMFVACRVYGIVKWYAYDKWRFK